MTEREHNDLRTLQDHWLALPLVRRMIEWWGEDDPIAMGFPGRPWPTFRDVQERLLPELREWFEDFFRGDS